tara:strand:+ start:667 stop:1317 length:651 start_codon:yes stop_codon:yes gene_type:complete
MINLLELFAGSRSIGKAAQKIGGFNVFSVDIKPFENIDLIQDIEFLKPSQIPFKPCIIWASPPCTSFSICAISHHRDGQKTISDFAKKTDRIMKNLLKLIKFYNCVFFIENPVGMLRKMHYMNNIDRVKITYCKYGAKNMKPTDIFSNDLYNLFNPNGWQPRPPCFNGNYKCAHEAAPRGSRSGTQGIKGNYERSKIPPALCRSILNHIKKKHNKN